MGPQLDGETPSPSAKPGEARRRPELTLVPPPPAVGEEDLVAEYFPAIYGYLARRVGRDLADDMAAEVFVRALADRARFDPELGTWRMWLFGIATKLVAKHRRAERRRLSAYARFGGSRSGGEGAGDGVDLMLDRVVAEDSLRSVASGLRRLSGSQRDALYLVGIAGLSYEEA